MEKKSNLNRFYNSFFLYDYDYDWNLSKKNLIDYDCKWQSAGQLVAQS